MSTELLMWADLTAEQGEIFHIVEANIEAVHNNPDGSQHFHGETTTLCGINVHQGEFEDYDIDRINCMGCIDKNTGGQPLFEEIDQFLKQREPVLA